MSPLNLYFLKFSPSLVYFFSFFTDANLELQVCNIAALSIIFLAEAVIN